MLPRANPFPLHHQVGVMTAPFPENGTLSCHVLSSPDLPRTDLSEYCSLLPLNPIYPNQI